MRDQIEIYFQLCMVHSAYVLKLDVLLLEIFKIQLLNELKITRAWRRVNSLMLLWRTLFSYSRTGIQLQDLLSHRKLPAGFNSFTRVISLEFSLCSSLKSIYDTTDVFILLVVSIRNLYCSFSLIVSTSKV